LIALFHHDACGLSEAIQLGETWQGWRLDVVDPSGNILLSIPLEPILHGPV
jgi:hypothetical protein